MSQAFFRRPVVIFVIVLAVLTSYYMKNINVYGLPTISCFIAQIIFYALHTPFTLKHYIYDALSLFEESNRYISPQLRAFEDIMLYFEYMTGKSLPSDQETFLNIVDKGCNALGCLVTIPHSTTITNHSLTIDEFNRQVEPKLEKDLLSHILLANSDQNIDGKKNTEDIESYIHEYFEPKNTRFLWIIGNDNIDNSSNASTIIFLHGCGYVFGGPSHIGFASHLSISTNTRILYIWYETPPQVTIPYQVNQVLTMYLYLIFEMNVSQSNILFIGDSAGGGLSLLSLQKLSFLSMSSYHPRGAILLSPWIDLTMTSQAWKENDDRDIILDYGVVHRCSLLAVDFDVTKLTCPHHSGLHGHSISTTTTAATANSDGIEQGFEENVQDLGLYILTSRHETLFHDSEQLVEKIYQDSGEIGQWQTKEIKSNIHENDQIIRRKLIDNNDNIDLMYEVENHRPHVWTLFVGLLPESDQTFQRLVTTANEWLYSD